MSRAKPEKPYVQYVVTNGYCISIHGAYSPEEAIKEFIDAGLDFEESETVDVQCVPLDSFKKYTVKQINQFEITED